MRRYPRNRVLIVRAQRQMLQDISVLWCFRMTGLGLYSYLNHQPVSVGSAAVALVVNGFGLSKRRLSLVQQFSAAGVAE